jgi:putative transposase
MAEKYQNKYRIKSARLQNWDYGWNAAYFITICTQNREYYFGNIENGKMQLSEIGDRAQKYLLEISQRFEYAKLDEFVVMPNHIHVIVIIDKIDDGRGVGRDAINRVSTLTPEPIKKPGGITGNKNPMLHQNISRIFNWYTGRVTFESRKIDKNYVWQSRFHDHIIRDNAEYNRIKNYIINNPLNWDDDEFNNPINPNSDNQL